MVWFKKEDAISVPLRNQDIYQQFFWKKVWGTIETITNRFTAPFTRCAKVLWHLEY